MTSTPVDKCRSYEVLVDLMIKPKHSAALRLNQSVQVILKLHTSLAFYLNFYKIVGTVQSFRSIMDFIKPLAELRMTDGNKVGERLK